MSAKNEKQRGRVSGHGTPERRRMLSVAAARELDRRAVSEYGLSLLVLMEHAALALRDEVLACLEERDGPVVVLCGPGNNGGDGMALARLLQGVGVEAAVLLGVAPESLKEQALTQARTLRAMGIPLLGADATVTSPRVVVDAVLGTGLSRAPTGGCGRLVERALEWGGHAEGSTVVIAADVPSGLDAQSGAAFTPCVRADTTVTFCGIMPGLLVGEGPGLAGRVVVADLNMPRKLLEELTVEAGESSAGGFL